jgi:hypothetical protein
MPVATAHSHGLVCHAPSFILALMSSVERGEKTPEVTIPRKKDWEEDQTAKGQDEANPKKDNSCFAQRRNRAFRFQTSLTSSPST